MKTVAGHPNPSRRSESLVAFRARLGPEFAHYSDADLIQLRRDIQEATRLLLDLYLLKKQNPGKSIPDFDSAEDRP